MTRFTFTKQERLHLNRDFKKVLTEGKSYRSKFLVLFVYKQNHNISRLGLIVSTKVGKAAKRNKLKRRLREIFRLNKHRLKKGYDIVFLAKENSTMLDFYQLKNIVFELWHQAHLFITSYNSTE